MNNYEDIPIYLSEDDDNNSSKNYESFDESENSDSNISEEDDIDNSKKRKRSLYDDDDNSFNNLNNRKKSKKKVSIVCSLNSVIINSGSSNDNMKPISLITSISDIKYLQDISFYDHDLNINHSLEKKDCFLCNIQIAKETSTVTKKNGRDIIEHKNYPIISISKYKNLMDFVKKGIKKHTYLYSGYIQKYYYSKIQYPMNKDIREMGSNSPLLPNLSAMQIYNHIKEHLDDDIDVTLKNSADIYKNIIRKLDEDMGIMQRDENGNIYINKQNFDFFDKCSDKLIKIKTLQTNEEKNNVAKNINKIKN